MKALLLTLTLLNCGDAITTHSALSIGAHETNPISNPFVLDGLRGGATVALWKAAPKAEKAQPKLTRTVVIALIAVEGFAVANNLRQMQIQRGFNR